MSTFTDIGFNNRLFLVTGHGERRFSIPPKIPLQEINHLRYDLAGILQKVPAKIELKVEAEAQELFHEWYMKFDRSVHSRRLDTYALRLMPLLAVNDLKTVIDVETVRKAIFLCDWQLEIRRLHDPIDADNALAKMEEKIRRTLRVSDGLKDWQIKKNTHATRDGLWIYERAKQNLVKAHEIRFDGKTKNYFWAGP